MSSFSVAGAALAPASSACAVLSKMSILPPAAVAVSISAAAVVLLTTLAAAWVLIGLYALFDTLRKKHGKR